MESSSLAGGMESSSNVGGVDSSILKSLCAQIEKLTSMLVKEWVWYNQIISFFLSQLLFLNIHADLCIKVYVTNPLRVGRGGTVSYDAWFGNQNSFFLMTSRITFCNENSVIPIKFIASISFLTAPNLCLFTAENYFTSILP